ncbi:MAG: SURF1 family protein [Alcanivoracaceae bacterium]|nr:SURF1 family protein [Alcanivoracaceae bacterium]
MSKRRFQPSIAALLATLAVMAVCVRLGVWQLDRAAQKRAWQEQVDTRGAAGAQTLPDLLARSEPAHYPVRFSGMPDNQHTVLLDNRMLEGVAGYYVLTPVVSDAGTTVLVNRGWLARGRDRQTLPTVPPLPTPVTIEGHAYVPGDAFTLETPGNTGQDWPARVQSVDIDALAERLGQPLAPFEVRVTPDYPLETGEQMVRVWHDARLGPERHRAYAVQWFAMAGAVCLIFLFASLRRTQATNPMDA